MPSITLDPLVSAGSSLIVRAGDVVTFQGAASDPGGTQVYTAVEWDFNYSGASFLSSASGSFTPTHVYNSPGVYPVALRVSELDGGTGMAFTVVQVKAVGTLLVNAGADAYATADTDFALSGAYDLPSDSVSSSGIAWDTNYDGDTFIPTITGTLAPTWNFAAPGIYQVALKITDDHGNADLDVMTVLVTLGYTGPTANAGTAPFILEGTVANFSGSVTDPDGTVTMADVAWDFNYDGRNFNPQVTGTLTPSWQYARFGSYQVALRVTDDHDITNIGVLPVVVDAASPAVDAGADQSLQVGDSAVFAGSFQDLGLSTGFTVDWDFNYDGTNFNGAGINTLTPMHTFTTPGTYFVALKVTDGDGFSSLDTVQVDVADVPALVADAGAAQTVPEGGTAYFAGTYTDALGTVDPTTVDWDFSFNGAFVADPSAHGDLGPQHPYALSGLYLVAFQVRDDGDLVRTGFTYVRVANAAPQVSPGPDQTVAEGAVVAFNGSATDAGGASDIVAIQWDFDYNGVTFVAAADGTFTPSHQFIYPGTYAVALQVTDASGAASLACLVVQVDNVAPTAAVTNSGAAESCPVTFTITGLTDPGPADSVTFLADWTGSGDFAKIQDVFTNPDGSLGFRHVYDDNGTYAPVIRIIDSDGAGNDYVQGVTVTNAGPVAYLVGGSYWGTDVADGAPIYLTYVSDPSHADMLAGFTYWFSLDGGPYASSSTPQFFLPAYTPETTYSVSAYVEDKDGGTSPTYTASGNIVAVNTVIVNGGTGSIRLNWSGATDPVVVDPEQTYAIAGNASGLTITLLTSDAYYTVYTNGGIATIDYDPGVTGVNLTVANYGANVPALVGTGAIGDVYLPPGDDTLGASQFSVHCRGDLGNITGPGGTGNQSAYLSGVTCDNLTGSIVGVRSIGCLQPRGWLGDDSTDVVSASRGIYNLWAYGVKATVLATPSFNASDGALYAGVGDGGVVGSITTDTLSNFTSKGDVNRLACNRLEGSVTLTHESTIQQLYVGAVSATAAITANLGGGIANLLVAQDAKGRLPALAGLPLRQAMFALQVPRQPAAAPPPRSPLSQVIRNNFARWMRDQPMIGGQQRLVFGRLNELSELHSIFGDEAAAIATLRGYFFVAELILIQDDPYAWNPETMGMSLADLDYYDRILVDPTNANRSEAVALQDRFTEGRDRIRNRVETLWANPNAPVPDPNAMHQGNIGDCSFLSALGSVAAKTANILVGKAHEVIPAGAALKWYTVSLNAGPRSMPLRVVEPTQAETAFFATSGADGLWVSVFEKAYTQLRSPRRRGEGYWWSPNRLVGHTAYDIGEHLWTTMSALVTGRTTPPWPSTLGGVRWLLLGPLENTVTRLPDPYTMGLRDADLRNLLRYSQAQDTMVTVDSFEPPPGSNLRLQIMPGIHAFSVTGVNFNVFTQQVSRINFMNPWNAPLAQVYYGQTFSGSVAQLYQNFRYICFEI